MKNLAPGEARTPDLRISLSVLTYKYDALTDCATGAEPFATSVWAIATKQTLKGIRVLYVMDFQLIQIISFRLNGT